jgi:6-pyruvoyltetrahydropterin/6-carboxytetrahydropterin synthase
MYTVSVRDHFMIAHSFRGEAFGPAQRLHGATYVVDLEFRRPVLDANGMVVDIGLASEVLKTIFERVVAAIGRGELGAGARGVESMRVTLHESHVASASFAGPVA